MTRGFEKLTDADKKMFESFCANYRAAQDGQTEVEFLAVQRKSGCLRVDLTKNGRKTYQEIFTSTTWG